MLLSDTLTFIILFISDLICIISGIIVHKKINKSQLKTAFSFLNIAMIICCTGLLLQNLLSNPLNINPIYFDYFVYIGNCLLPISFFFTGLIFNKTKIKLSKKYLWLLVIPIISLLCLWTNDYHHLFYIDYSIDLSKNVYGPMFIVFDIYTLVLFAIGIFLFLKQSISSSGLFSTQGILMIIGSSIPIVQNILSTTKVISTTIYLTPICFSISLFFICLAIFKFNFLKVAPITLQKIVDRMSDSYIVINENNTIADFNETFLKTFHFSASNVRNRNIIELLNIAPSNSNELVLALEKAQNSSETFTFERHFEKLNKYFNIEINNITNDGNFLGILILFKDITQHIEDMNTIKSNQDLLIEKERLASLGQMIGGIAHNLKTPIMSISGAAEGLKDLVKEYDSSIEDPDVTLQDHHDIARDMDVWIEKIKTHTSYMSDIITAVKGQAVTLSEDESDSFTIEELFKRINILMKHELKNALIDMNVTMNVEPSLALNGNVNSLVQVVNNLISNAIQSYNGKTNESIDLIAEKQNNSIVISVSDHGCGMSKEVKDKLFKEMITTKGKNGTGLGLFMSYSTIRGHFNGNMTFESEVGIGTTFKIILPL
ncbi:MAG: PAS domain S-box protein [Clostridia bacterium]|nr:PAS domain S-box protein [Clostridia bacterium]